MMRGSHSFAIIVRSQGIHRVNVTSFMVIHPMEAIMVTMEAVTTILVIVMVTDTIIVTRGKEWLLLHMLEVKNQWVRTLI